MSQTLEIHEPVVSFVTKAQQTSLDFLNDAAKRVADLLPALPVGPAGDFVIRGGEFADGGMALAEDLLARNRAYLADLFAVTKTLLDGLAAQDAPAPKATKTAKASKAA